MAGGMVSFRRHFFLMVILPLFNHRGATPLFYIQGQAVTKESVLMGAVVTLMLVSVLLWMRLGLYLLDSEKLLYLSGRIVPALGLMLSQIFRMIPLMKKDIFRYMRTDGPWNGAQRGIFLEACPSFCQRIVCADRLEPGGNSGDFHLHGIPRVWCREENQFSQIPLPPGRWMVCGCFLVLSGVGIGMAAAGGYEVYYYPELQAVPLVEKALAGIVCGGLAGMIPMGYDIYWNRKERNYDTHH